MTRRSVRAGAATLLLLAGCMPPAPLPAPGKAAGAPAADLERQVHERINQYRVRQGLPALGYDARIAEIARAHSRAMASGERPLGHAGMSDRARAVAALVPLRGLAENVAQDSRTGAGLVEGVVEGWIRSPGHRANLAGPYDLTGVGVARVAGGPYYFTQVLVDRP